MSALLPRERADGETYVFTKKAAELMGVAEQTISGWRRRELITPVEGSPPRKPLYRLSDLRRAERVTRERAQRQMMRRDGSDAA